MHTRRHVLAVCSVASLIGLSTPSLAEEAAPTAPPTAAAATLTADVGASIDAAALEVLKKTGVPSASIAIVRDGRIAYVHAYGNARIEPKAVAAKPAMRYAIGSISKQFTASALLLLQQDGKLSLDDKVGKWLPKLTRANDITIRQLLNHTSGYQDFWPQDYVMTPMLAPIEPEALMDRWARQPLDYEPGTKWQYSNTGYTIAGRIVELASGQPLFEFLEQRIFTPLGMATVTNFDLEPAAHGTVAGYEAFALGPPRRSKMSGSGWLFGAGGLAMAAEDLARWDISLMNQTLLSKTSYRELETETLLESGLGTDYGLGLDVEQQQQRRALAHGGEVSGFTALNTVYPDDRTAIVVLTNQMAARAHEQLSEKIRDIVFAHADAADAARTAQARAIYEGLQQGRLDRGLFTTNANDYFSPQAIADFQAGLGPLGAPKTFEHQRTWLRGGMTGRSYEAVYADRKLRVWTYELADGKLEQFQVAVTQ